MNLNRILLYWSIVTLIRICIRGSVLALRIIYTQGMHIVVVGCGLAFINKYMRTGTIFSFFLLKSDPNTHYPSNTHTYMAAIIGRVGFGHDD